MLHLQSSENLPEDIKETIQLYYSLHLAGLGYQYKLVSLKFDTREQEQHSAPVFRCEINVHPTLGETIRVVNEREVATQAIEQGFARIRRALTRRIRLASV